MPLSLPACPASQGMAPARDSGRQYLRPARALFLCVALLIWLLAPGAASAHAHLTQADPAPDSVIARAPEVASFLFDERLNPTLTRVRITDVVGRQVAGAGGHLAAGHNGELWQVPMPSLRSGAYSVFWTSESATDGHVMSSFYIFRIAPSGSADSVGAVTGAAAGSYGGVSGGTPDALLDLSAKTLIAAAPYWLEMIAQALWLGALIVELAVLAPLRRGRTRPEARLAAAATPPLWRLLRWALGTSGLALVLEVLTLAVQGTGGDWGSALAPSTLGGILSSQNGHYLLLRAATLVVAALLAARPLTRRENPSYAAEGTVARQLPPEPAHAGKARPPRALGITALPPRLSWEMARGPLALLAALYMLFAAFAGHAANVTPGWQAYPIDWLHLLFTGAWAGGIATLAIVVLPRRRALPPEERAPAVLALLNRFSAVAFTAVVVLALSGLYNALNHLEIPAGLADTTYGHLLLIKIGLVALLMALSASHVWGLRPRLARAHHRARRDAEAQAAVHDYLGALGARLRLETAVGAAILLATALMGQTLPPLSALAVSNPAAPTSITGTATLADLRGELTVAPPAVGTTTFTLHLWEKGTPVTGDSGAAIVHLYPLAQPNVRANLTPQWRGGSFMTRGSLAAAGTWRADVQVRTSALNEYRTLPYTFTVGVGAAFLASGLNPDAVAIGVTPGRLSSANTFTISGLQATDVRLLSQSLDMNMGILPYPAVALGGGRWRASGLYAPMNGRWGLTVQLRRGDAWIDVRQFVYQVPFSGPMRLLTPQSQAGPAAPGAGTPSAPQAGLNKAFNVAFARTLPYTVLVSQMGSNGVRPLGGALLPTGLQAHGIDVLDGTPYAYVTNFGAEPGTVSKIDLRTMTVVRTYAVGLGPAHVIFAAGGRIAFVTDFRSSDVYRLDLASGATQRITFPGDNCFEPHGIDISEDGQTLFVACAGEAWIYTIDTRTLRAKSAVITGPGAFGVTVDAPRHEVWVTNQTVNNVTVLDEHTLKTLATIPVGKGPALLVPTPDGKTVYVADQLGNAVSVVDAAARRVVATVPVAAQPHGPDVTADGKYIYVASIGGNAVTIIRTSDNKVVSIVPSASGANEVAIAH